MVIISVEADLTVLRLPGQYSPMRIKWLWFSGYSEGFGCFQRMTTSQEVTAQVGGFELQRKRPPISTSSKVFESFLSLKTSK